MDLDSIKEEAQGSCPVTAEIDPPQVPSVPLSPVHSHDLEDADIFDDCPATEAPSHSVPPLHPYSRYNSQVPT